MWCNLGKSVETRTCDISSFLFDGRYILQKTSLESVQWFQGYEQLKDSQNNRKQKKLISFSGYIPINPADFRLIPLDRNT